MITIDRQIQEMIDLIETVENFNDDFLAHELHMHLRQLQRQAIELEFEAAGWQRIAVESKEATLIVQEALMESLR